MKKQILVAVLLIGGYGVTRMVGQAPAAGPFTADQAAAGAQVYAQSCAMCHQANLSGQNNAPQLAGSLFMGSWGNRTAGDLLAFIAGAMPPDNPSTLSEQAYVSITAFILQSNGARPGAAPLTAADKTAIRTFATGVQVAQNGGGAGRGGRGG